MSDTPIVGREHDTLRALLSIVSPNISGYDPNHLPELVEKGARNLRRTKEAIAEDHRELWQKRKAQIRELEAAQDNARYLEAENERLRDGLIMATYHAENLRRYIDKQVVRDLAESEAGYDRARQILTITSQQEGRS